MDEVNAGVPQMLENYRELLQSFSSGEMTANEFEHQYLTRFKSDCDQVTGAEFDVLDELFADVDDYVEDPQLRAQTGGIGGDELKERARNVYARLFDRG